MTRPLDAVASAAFVESFGAQPTVLAQAPSRVELLGNHTDYNGGLVLSVAIDRFTVVAGRPREGAVARVRSVNFEQSDEFNVDSAERGEAGSWVRYVRGVVWALQQAYGPMANAFDAAIAGDVPLGAGLSSSASLQAAVAAFLSRAVGASPLAEKSDDDQVLMSVAKVLQRSENEFVGVASGLLDQFSVLFGRAGHALRLDCRSLAFERIPLVPAGSAPPAIVICDSKTSRRLADGMYNQRREECERIVRFFQAQRGPGVVESLRDITLTDLQSHWEQVDPIGRLRARHVLNENDRVLRGSELLRAGDLAGFGRLMCESHASSRDDFANSSPALDALFAAAEAAPGFLGAKLSGAGWAGCTVNLVEPGLADRFAVSVANEYSQRTGTVPTVHVCQVADGASSDDVAREG